MDAFDWDIELPDTQMRHLGENGGSGPEGR